MIDTRLWGKSAGLEKPYPLMGHLVDTAMVAGAVWDGALTVVQHAAVAEALGVAMAEARRLVMFWAGLHDIGKILPRFQDMAAQDRPAHCAFLSEETYAHDRERDSQAEKIRHECATSRALPQLLAALGYPTAGRPARLLLTQVAQLLGGHHGRYPLGVEPQDLRDPLRRLPELGIGGWADQRREHVAALHGVLGRPEAPVARAMPVELAVVVAGVVIVSDWLASQDHVVSAQQAAADEIGGLRTPQSLLAHAKRASEAAPALVRDAGLGRASFRRHGFAGLFPEIARPHPLQVSIEAGLPGAVSGPGVLLVTAPPGEGKTEAALYAATVMGAACGSGGLFFALPTQATANQMYDRVVGFARRNLLDSAQVTLLHGSADLNERYAEPSPNDDGVEPRVLSDHDGGLRESAEVSVVASRWLRLRGRGILAPIAVGTVDQALMGVLPLKRNALRHLGLSGKTVVVDEAHAYDAYTHALLLRLLVWLGAMGVPVVLLSATLTGETAAGLVEAYLSGAGREPGSYRLPPPAYPGWLYADARSGSLTAPEEPVGSVRARRLSVDVLPVTHTYDATAPDGRLAALIRELHGVTAEGGCAAVICTTVAEAQRTYEALRDHYREHYGPAYAGWDDRSTDDAARQDAEAGPRLRLLHARFPARRRAAITAEAESWFGRIDKEGIRRPEPPRGTVLVSTQVIEQSLDLDFDLIVSDLAPMALLLQRAGRVWRHSEPGPSRPAWCREPRLAVLAPVGDDGRLSVPAAWGDVYAPSLLQRTLELMERRKSDPVRVPEDVQQLIDEVYAPEFTSTDPDALMKRDIKRLTDDMARRGLAGMVMLPPPAMVGSLHQLTTSDADEDLVATRLGAETVQLLPVFYDSEGKRWLDEACTIPFPERGSRNDGRFTRVEIRALLGHVVPLAHGPWRQACAEANDPPASWRREPRLARLVLLPHRIVAGDGLAGAVLGDYTLTLTHSLGLVISRAQKS
ncbi:CRISPR-associated helicase Cas3' [Peterkaempfera bronchialis]|uniref:CRISPR-associated helicase Cas3 n=1 Tax=Peterkaempfera bronchialis TaxID=2126346 RepID=A0A345T1G1_9ACTN|nr:CRISPR-associated helicase Cas3' [Peterkaempfera bronchialis]AXI79816.1 CRISPR-associated helicase Cas3' [Peterkaempfera bronchialis]